MGEDEVDDAEEEEEEEEIDALLAFLVNDLVRVDALLKSDLAGEVVIELLGNEDLGVGVAGYEL
jgi:hypothetical protein